MYRPTLSEAMAFQGSYQMVPISRTIFSDIKTPIEVLRTLKTVSNHCFILESLESPERWGRYTFLGFEPTLELTCKNGMVTTSNGVKKTQQAADPGQAIREIIAANQSPRLNDLPPFTGGLVGYFSYDFIQYSEPTLTLDAEDQEGFHDMDLMLFDKIIAFDHLKQTITVIVNAKTECLEQSYPEAIKQIDRIIDLIVNGAYPKETPAQITSPFRQLFDKETFCAMIETAKQHIREGDIFQVVLSNRLDADFTGSLLNTYRILRTTNPSPYMFYLSGDDVEIAGASPETLVKLENNTLYTFPLAGTRPRGKTEQEDQQLERELLNDPKELSEHNMLVDLGRNDLGKISEFGTVTVDRYMEIQRYSHVMHIGSTVQGVIRQDKSAVDAIESVLPAGTLSGAPKIRACEIINQLENNKRGIYGGAIGYIDFTGNMDTCIAIRIAFQKNGKVFIRSGAGIVADSIPENEYQECINKAQAVVNAVIRSKEELDG